MFIHVEYKCSVSVFSNSVDVSIKNWFVESVLSSDKTIPVFIPVDNQCLRMSDVSVKHQC